MHLLSKKATPKAIRSALSQLPEQLDDVYDLTLERINGQDREDVVLANRILTWVIFAVRLLTTLELQWAVSVI